MEQKELEYLRQVEDQASRTGWVSPLTREDKEYFPICVRSVNGITSTCPRQIGAVKIYAQIYLQAPAE